MFFTLKEIRLELERTIDKSFQEKTEEIEKERKEIQRTIKSNLSRFDEDEKW